MHNQKTSSEQRRLIVIGILDTLPETSNISDINLIIEKTIKIFEELERNKKRTNKSKIIRKHENDRDYLRISEKKICACKRLLKRTSFLAK